VIAYTGSYVEEGDAFTASIATERHTQGQPSVFGIDEIDMTLTGKSTRKRHHAPGPLSKLRSRPARPPLSVWQINPTSSFDPLQAGLDVFGRPRFEPLGPILRRVSAFGQKCFRLGSA
jgi:hypothetical protein